LNKIDVSETEFKNPDELFTIVTKYVNSHDILVQSLDCSGQGLAEGTKERRENCWNNFVGSKGRAKDVAIFACFIIWEGRSTRWKSRRLPSNTVRSSNLDSSLSDSTGSLEGRSSKRSKKASEYLEVAAALNPKETLAQETSRKNLEVAQLGLMQAKTKSVEQKLLIDAGQSLRAAESHEITKLRDAINDDSFKLLPEPVRNTIMKKYMDLFVTGDV
jgi:hypothetical protein